MEEETQVYAEEEGAEYSEIVEITDDNKSAVVAGSGNGISDDVYVAVGKNDSHVVKWTLDHSVSPGSRLFLVHVFPPMTYIATPVGRLSRSQLSEDQARVYVNEDRNKRKNLLEKYIRLCRDAKVPVDTMLLESNTTAKTILDLIPVVNITHLVMGTKRSPFIRQLRKGQGKGEYVRKNAPEFCKVSLVYNGQRTVNGQLQATENFPAKPLAASSGRRPDTTQQNSERNFFDCMCFSGKPN